MDKRKAQLSSKLKEMLRSKSKMNSYSTNFNSATTYGEYKRSNSNNSNDDKQPQSKYKISTLSYCSPKKQHIKNKINAVKTDEDDNDDSIHKDLAAYKSQFVNPTETKIERAKDLKDPERNQSKAIQILEKLRAERIKQQDISSNQGFLNASAKQKVK
jgi:hypothetical protein